MATKNKKTAGKHLTKKDKDKRPVKTAKKRSGWLAAVLAAAILAAAAVAGGVIVGRSDRILPNISVHGIDVGGMTVEEATAAIGSSEYEPSEAGSVEVYISEDFSFTVNTGDAGMDLGDREAAEAAYATGHSGKPLRDLAAYIKCLVGGAEADVLSAASLEALRGYIGEKLAPLTEMLDAGYRTDIEAGTLSLIKGADAKLDIDGLCELTAKALSEGETSLRYELHTASKPKAPDFDAIRNAVFSECVSAEYDRENDKVTEHKVGVDFDVSAALAAWQSAETGRLVEIKLDITEPEFTSEKLSSMLFADVLGEYTTNYSFSDPNRANNVELAADKINGLVLMPGEEFSYNDVVEERTEAAGFKPAGAYSGGAVVSEVGGGICQVSSTVYCAALYANLRITARDCHHFLVGYVPAGLDATVSWGGPEFKFVNNREYPIKIVVKHSPDMKLTVEILGTDVDGSYVEMTYGSYQCYDETYPDVAVGVAANTYRNVYAADGSLISQTKEAYSYYYYHDEDIVWPEEDPYEDPEDKPEPIEEEDPEEPGEETGEEETDPEAEIG